MPRDSKIEASLFGKTWVHVFEEDTAEGAVFRLEDDDIPLSRRPRARFELDSGGKARVYVPGADDRYVEQPATWRKDNGAIVIRTRDGRNELRITKRSAARLVVEMKGAGKP
jgi:hypothetical protein